jgi:hypothetical protein
MHTRRQRCEVPILAMAKVPWSFHTAKSIPPSPREAPQPRGRVSRPLGSTLPGVPLSSLDTGTRARAHGEKCGRMASRSRTGGSRAHDSRWFIRGHAPHGCRPQPVAAASATSGTPRPLVGPSSRGRADCWGAVRVVLMVPQTPDILVGGLACDLLLARGSPGMLPRARAWGVVVAPAGRPGNTGRHGTATGTGGPWTARPPPGCRQREAGALRARSGLLGGGGARTRLRGGRAAMQGVRGEEP